MKKNLILISIFIVLFWSYYLLTNLDDMTTKQDWNYPFDFLTLNYDLIIYKKWENNWYEILKKDEWFDLKKYSNNKTYKAKKWIVESLISNIKSINFDRIAAKSKSSWNKYDLNDSSSKLIIDKKEISIWKRENFTKEYVTENNNENVYVIDRSINMMFKDANNFIDKTIYKVWDDIDTIKTFDWENRKVYNLTWSWWTLDWNTIDVNKLLTLEWYSIIENLPDENIVDWVIKYFAWNELIKEIQVWINNDSCYVEMDTWEYYFFNKSF